MLTRAEQDAADWVHRIAAEGAEPVVLPCISTEAVADPTLGQKLATALEEATWLIFTSRRGVDAAAEHLHNQLPSQLQVATVGASTAARVGKRFGRVAHVGGGNSRTLARELIDESLIDEHSRCVLVLATNAGNTLEEILGAAGAAVERFDVYRTIPMPAPATKRALSALACDTVIFASPSAVAGFGNQFEVDTDVQMVTIGPSTSAAVREHGWAVSAEAREPDLSAILEAMLEIKGV